MKKEISISKKIVTTHTFTSEDIERLLLKSIGQLEFRERFNSIDLKISNSEIVLILEENFCENESNEGEVKA